MRGRCVAARQRALARQGKPNQALGSQDIHAHAQPDSATAQFLHTASVRLGWSARSLHRTLKVARTIADLADSANVELVHAAEALQYRRANAFLS
jgi:magnesium chelatase family protein